MVFDMINAYHPNTIMACMSYAMTCTALKVTHFPTILFCAMSGLGFGASAQMCTMLNQPRHGAGLGMALSFTFAFFPAMGWTNGNFLRKMPVSATNVLGMTFFCINAHEFAHTYDDDEWA